MKRQSGFQTKVSHLPVQTLTEREDGNKVSSDTETLSKIFCAEAITEVINSIYNVTTYHRLLPWPWNYTLIQILL